MAFKYGCFVSYAHGQYDLLKGFIDQLAQALGSELEALMDEGVCIDQHRLKPGFAYNEELANAICESVCMVVVYSPRYERHEYCVREFEGMALLDDERRKLIAEGGPVNAARRDGQGHVFIIPIVLRGSEDVPARIKSMLHYVDFSKFTLAMPDLIRNQEFIGHIRDIAKVIYEQYVAYQNSGVDFCSLCPTFKLPDKSNVKAWRPQFVNR